LRHRERGFPAAPSGQDRQRQKNGRTGKSGGAKPGMDQEANRQKNRRPGQIDNGDWARASQEAANLIEVAHWLMRFGGATAVIGQPDHGIVDGSVKTQVEQRGNAYHQPRADHVEPALEGIGQHQQQR
jgi:hypothetical protein